MKYKKTIILLALVVFLLSIAGVSASEIGDTIASENANTIELSADNDIEDNLQTSEENEPLASTDYDEAIAQTDTEVLGADSAKYSDLAAEISQPGNINLTHKNYTYNGGETITISEANKVIDGNGAVIDMNGSTIRAFAVTASGVTIKNLTIKNANYNGNGGAIYFSSSATSGTVSNCNFADNTATYGGAVRMSSGTVSNCNFVNNTASEEGGAIYFSSSATSGTVSNCNFADNTATYGGAVYFLNTGNVTNCNFADNTANVDGGAINMGSGTVSNCNFADNTATINGGAVYFYDNGTVSNCNFTDNTANYGGSVFFNLTGNVTNCNFTDNTAYGDGGAVYFYDEGSVSNCNFTGNTATRYGGGAIYFLDQGTVTNCNFVNNSATGEGSWGGAIRFTSTGTVSNCNFADNSASRGGAIFSNKWFTTADTCIFKRNSGDNVNTIICPPTLNVNNFTTVYGSGEKLTFDLKTNSSIPVTNGNISISVYSNNEWVGNYTCLSGEGWIPDLPVGSYIAFFYTEYAEFQEINRTVTITMPNVRYSINVTSLTTNNKTVNITAKSDIPKDILWESKLLFILPNGIQIEATYGANGTWWAEHTFDAYGEYKVNATYVGLDNVTINNGTITINKVNSTLILDNIVLDYGETKNVTVTTTGATGITAKIGESDAKVDEFVISIPVLDAGNYTLTVTTIPDDDHNPVTKEVNITVNRVNSTLTVSDIVFDYGSSGNTVVSLTGADGVNASVVGQPKAVVKVNGTNITVSGLDAGTYTLTVTTIADANHNNMTKNATITVNKVNATLTVNDVVLDYGESKNITVTTEGANGIVAKIDGVDVTVNGYTISISGLGAGNYTLTVTTIPDNNHNPVTKEVNITVNKLSTEIILANETLDLKVGDEVPVLANLTPAGAGNLTFTSSNEDLVFVEDNVTIVANSQGQAIITVSFAGNENYTAAENKTITVNVALNDANVSVENDTLNLKVDETCTINATINPDTIMLKIKYTSSNESVVTVDKNGIVTAVGEGRAIITLEVGDDEIYAKKSTTVTVTVNKINTTADVSIPENITVGDNSTVNVILPADATGNVTVKVDGEVVDTVPVSNGTASVKLPALDAGKHTVEVTYSGDDKYKPASKTSTIGIGKDSTNISAADVTATYNVNKYLVITLKDSKGNPLSNAIVTVDLNTIKNYTTDKNGQIRIKVSNLVPKTYNAKITFAGNNNYLGSDATAKVVVKKATPKITASNKMFKTTTKTKKYAITLKDNTGKPIRNAKVYLKVNGKTYKATTNSKGKATFKITKLSKTGTFKATVTYKGNKYYNKVTKKVTVKVVSAFKTISKGSKAKSTVKEIQRALKNNGYYLTAYGHYLKVDGIYWDYTVKAVKQFQKAKGLKVTGKVDEKTAKKLGLI